jgi:elongation factor P--(R)-beta-lysine ligase
MAAGSGRVTVAQHSDPRPNLQHFPRRATVAEPSMTSPCSPWWAPDALLDRRPFLHARGRLLAAVRRLFGSWGFAEVETAILQVSPGNEAHLHALATQLVAPDGTRTPRFLRTSPEFACKKLVAAGERRIFEIARAFRNRERGALHHPEFTLLEWYRAEEGYDVMMTDCAALLAAAAEAIGVGRLTFRDRTADPFAEPERMAVAEGFERFAGIDLLSSVTRDETDRDCLAMAARKAGIRVAPDDTWSDIFSRVLVERIEPYLGIGRPCIFYEYPVAEAALARSSAKDARLAERFELYVCGVELANAFGELTDPHEQRRRLQNQMAEKERVYGERYPIDEEFLAALSQMPQASGSALGFDRLVMILTGASRIEQVLWTPTA